MAALTYEESIERSKRQRQLIEALRKQAEDRPQAQTFGKHIVQPHWSQELMPALNLASAHYMGKKQDEADAATQQRMQAEAQGWIGQRPQATTQELQGPPTEEGEGPGAITTQPTEQSQLEWAQRGQANPLTKALAAKYGEDVLIKGPEREEARVARKDAATLATQARMDQIKQQGLQRLQELELRLQDQSLTREQTAAIQAQADETKRFLGELSARTAREVAAGHDQARRDVAAAAAAMKEAAAQKPPKPLPAAQSKAWTENNVAKRQTERTLSMLVDEKGNIRPEARKSLSKLYMVPFSEEVGQELDPKGVPLRAAIGNIGSMKIHERSGAAVSAKEHPRLKPFVPSPADTPEAARDKLKDFLRIYSDIQQEIEDYAEDMNYIKPGGARAAREGPGITNPNAVIQPPPLATPGINPAAPKSGGLPPGWTVN